MKQSPPVLFVLLAVLSLSPSLPGEDKPRATPVPGQIIDTLQTVRRFKEVAISPDGKRLAWVETLPVEKNASPDSSAIMVEELDGSNQAPRRITAGNGTSSHAEHAIAWSPDGTQLAFLSDKENKGQLQLYVGTMADAKVRKLTSLTGFLAGPRWSPDSKTLALLFTEDALREAGPMVATARDVGVIGEKIYHQRLTTVELDSGKVRQISPSDLYVYEFDWSPDGKHVVATAAPGPGDNNWYIAQLVTITLSSGETKLICKPAMQIATPRWSPDGKTITFLGGLMSDEPIPAGDIYTLPALGGKPRNQTPDRKASPAWLSWLPSNQILFGEHIDGQSGLARLDPESGKIETLWTGAEVVTTQGWPGLPSVSLARDGKTCGVIRHSFQQPPEVWAGPIGSWKQRTQANRDHKPGWGEARSLHWKSDAFSIQGWLVFPRNYDPKQHYPLVVIVHGGPSWLHRSAWPTAPLEFAEFSAAGYFVLLPNPRGSYGHGEVFTKANVKDFGHGDLHDILAGVDEVLKTVPIDPNRVGITGWSYGGYMTMWAVTQTERFHAAVAGAGIANWQSYYGQNQIDQWLIPFFGASVYDNPAMYARSSPINYIKKVKTPTLILVGERDAECPAPQSLEFWHALKTLRVKTQLVVYPDEGHRIVQPKHRRDIARRSLDWFNEQLR